MSHGHYNYGGVRESTKQLITHLIILVVMLLWGVLVAVVAYRQGKHDGYEKGKKDFAPTVEVPWPGKDG